jgi:hypothetical protein
VWGTGIEPRFRLCTNVRAWDRILYITARALSKAGIADNEFQERIERNADAIRSICSHNLLSTFPDHLPSCHCNKSCAAAYHEQRCGTQTDRQIAAPCKEQMMQSQTIVVPQRNGPGLLVRALYFILIGWWFSGIWAAVAWILCITIIGLPLGLYMLNRLRFA